MKKILVLNFFPAFTPASSGGELRYFYCYQHLSNHYDITLLSPTNNDAKIETVEHSSSFREYRIPKEEIHNRIHWKLEEENLSSEFSALSCAYSADFLNEYHRHYLKLYPDADIIIHDSPYMLNYDLFFGMDNKPRVYNSYNLEYDLLTQMYRGEHAKKHLDFIFQLEKKLVSKAQIVFATSTTEKRKFQELYKVPSSHIKLAPNGINPEDFLTRDETIIKKTALFIGSGHPPNLEAVKFIIEQLAPNAPDVLFLVAGSCGDSFSSTLPNLKLLGRVDEEKKEHIFKTSDIAINPMFSGAGTNLKTLEFLSMGIPMVSTDVGVRGIELEDSKHFILADKENFHQQINSLIEDEPLKEKISHASKEYVNKTFDWKNIAQNIDKELQQIVPSKKKTILLLNDFEVSNPFGGGEIRINRLYSKLSNAYSVVMLCLNREDSVSKKEITDNFLELSFPMTKEHKKENNRINLQHNISANDIISSYMIGKNELFLSAVEALAPTFDITVLCHPYMYEALSKTNHNFLVHESLNHELELKEKMLKEHPQYNMLIKQAKKVESNSCIESDLIISVSKDDNKGLNAYRGTDTPSIVTIKNGVDIIEKRHDFNGIKEMFKGHTTILFIGSAHLPNIDSAKYIIDTLAPKLKNCYFILIGTVCESLSLRQRLDNVLLFGKLDIEYKNALCSIADIAINPMFGGSGSNLKLAEYFSWRTPTITTKFGARGYDITHNKEAIICEIEEFAENIKKLENDKIASESLGQNAYAYVTSNVEWSILAKKYKNILDKKVYGISRKKLLIVTYRFTTPPLGGAEVYMYELIKALDRLDKFDITVAYLDAYNIQNQYHFSIEATRNTNRLEHQFKNVTFKKFKYSELDDRNKYKNSKLLIQEWIRESIESANRFLDIYEHSLLLGGWNFPERLQNSTQIWSSSKAQVYIKNHKNILIEGFTVSKKQITITLDDKRVKEQTVNGKFKIELIIPTNGVLTLETTSGHVSQDIRPLGLCITSIILDDKALDLAHGYAEFLREHRLSTYIDEMINIANQRESNIDEMFQQNRGLNSPDLESYLDKNTKSFDVLLGHSIPFATTTLTSKYAQKHDIPYTLLTHMHFDDRFYHWKSYYQAMQHADGVFASPTTSISLFYDKLNIKSIEVPGGGIEASEYTNISTHAFDKLYNSKKPFFFYLGRKSGAKNYDVIVEAIEKINQKEHRCNLVMIGREEDNRTINSKFTHYLGEQPREVVLGALKKSLALVNMSESESFGIVIVEAWMLQKPVIINEQCPAFTELVKDGLSGLYANKKNLDIQLGKLLEDNRFATTLGQNGHQESSNYLWSKIASHINNQLLSTCK
jgi:glycosyltransferase involved in cell wall biosynthesis